MYRQFLCSGTNIWTPWPMSFLHAIIAYPLSWHTEVCLLLRQCRDGRDAMKMGERQICIGYIQPSQAQYECITLINHFFFPCFFFYIEVIWLCGMGLLLEAWHFDCCHFRCSMCFGRARWSITLTVDGTLLSGLKLFLVWCQNNLVWASMLRWFHSFCTSLCSIIIYFCPNSFF